MSVSDLTGVFFNEEKNKYQARIPYGGKERKLGHYKLASDAALAFDTALRLLGPSKKMKPNFASEKDHKKLRAVESRRIGLTVVFGKVKSSISSKIDGLITKVRAKDPLIGGNGGSGRKSKR